MKFFSLELYFEVLYYDNLAFEKDLWSYLRLKNEGLWKWCPCSLFLQHVWLEILSGRSNLGIVQMRALVLQFFSSSEICEYQASFRRKSNHDKTLQQSAPLHFFIIQYVVAEPPQPNFIIDNKLHTHTFTSRFFFFKIHFDRPK